MQPESFKNLFSITQEALQFVVGRFRGGKLHQFNFIELMLTDKAAGVLAV